MVLQQRVTISHHPSAAASNFENRLAGPGSSEKPKNHKAKKSSQAI
jgi:hypothetical protein